MTILVAEYACSGTLPVGELPPSIVAEGRAMLGAAAADLRSAGVRVLLDRSLRGAWEVPDDELVEPSGRTWSEQLGAALDGCTAAFVVAPEFDGLLAEAERVVAAKGVRWLGCSAAAIALCADKWATFERLRDAGVPTVPTVRGGVDPPWRPPWVVKPRDGAGSLGLRIVESTGELASDPTFVVQPLVDGAARSVGLLFDASGTCRVLPPAEQRFAPGDEPFRYVGGRLPVVVDGLDELAAHVSRAIPGLGGYVGVDVVVPTDGRPLVVEINPRLTTSFLGYRALAAESLLVRLIEPRDAPIRWRSGEVSFDVPEG